MTKINKNFVINNSKEFVFGCLKKNKIKTFVLSVLMIITFFTGIIVAFKTKSDYGTVGGLGIIDLSGGIKTTLPTRLLSITFVYLVLFACSFVSFLFPLAAIILCYRSYLLGLNVALIIVLYGFSGALLSLFIALPCQLIILLALGLFYLLLCHTNKEKRCYGYSKMTCQKSKICLCFAGILLLLCVFESLLLVLFSPKVILVI